MALSLGTVGAYGALNGYWGQHAGHDLRTFCDSGIKYATVGFVNLSPEHDPSEADYPGINFSSHCWGTSFPDAKGNPSMLLNHCASLMTDIPYCQSKGVKVILSIGGDYSTTSNNYAVSTPQNGEYFANFLYNAFGPYNEKWTGPRPFDPSPSEHVAVDGYDFDIEAKLDNKPYIAMINKFRALDKSVIITGGPQCPTSDNLLVMKEMIQNAAFDALFIQFYNNPVCDYIPGNTPGDSFNYDEWVKVVEKGQSRNAKLFVGLPSSSTAAGSGYIEPQKVKDLVCKYSGKKNFGGISLWDLHLSADNVIDGKAFHEHVLDALEYGCKPVPTSTSTTVSSTTTTSTSTSTKSTTTTTSTSTTSKATTTSTTSTSKATTTSTSTSSKPTTTSTTQATSTSTSTSTSSKPTTTSTTQATSSSTSSKPTTTSTTVVTSAKSTTASSTDKVTTSSSTKAVTSTSSGGVTSSVRDTTSSTPSSTLSSTGKWSNSTITSSTSVSMTTSTVFTTTTRTVTKCPPYITDCPNKTGYVTTETIALYTTVCPVTATAQPPKPTASASEKTPLPLTTSTVYTTTTRTVTKCPPEVTNCPVGKVTTEVIPWYTTVCPVKETETGKIPQPTPSGPGGVSPPQSTTTTTTTSATSTIYKTITVPGGSTLETLTKPTAATSKPGCSGPGCPVVSSALGCSGPGCPGASSAPGSGASSTPGSGCTGPNCPSGVAKPTGSFTGTPGSGCKGPNCPSGVAKPTESLIGTPVGPSTIPTKPVQAGASALTIGLTGLIAMVAVQVFAL